MERGRSGSLAPVDHSNDEDFDYVNMDAAGRHGERPVKPIERAEDYLFGHHLDGKKAKAPLRMPTLSEIRSTLADPLAFDLDKSGRSSSEERRGSGSSNGADGEEGGGGRGLGRGGRNADKGGSSGGSALDSRSRFKASLKKLKERLQRRWTDGELDAEHDYVDFDVLQQESQPKERKSIPASFGFKSNIFSVTAMRRNHRQGGRQKTRKNQVPLDLSKVDGSGSYVPPTLPEVKHGYEGEVASRFALPPEEQIEEAKAQEKYEDIGTGKPPSAGDDERGCPGYDGGEEASRSSAASMSSAASAASAANGVDWAQRRRDGSRMRRDYDLERLKWKKIQAEKRLQALHVRATEISRCAKALNQEIQSLDDELQALDEELGHASIAEQ
eukprot:scaffold630_cov218-Pinguiococcus_pyrenoidosus.AAC.5